MIIYFGNRLTYSGGKQNKQITTSKERKGMCQANKKNMNQKKASYQAYTQSNLAA